MEQNVTDLGTEDVLFGNDFDNALFGNDLFEAVVNGNVGSLMGKDVLSWDGNKNCILNFDWLDFGCKGDRSC